MTSLAEALPAEIKRVREVQDQYKELRGTPNVLVEPQITMMEAAISEGVQSLASGDVVRMLRAYKNLKGYES